MEIAELLEIEHRGWQSLCDGTGAQFYGELMTADGVMVLAHGFALDRDAVVASLNGAPRWARYEIRAPRLVELGDDSAALLYTGHAEREGEPSFEALMSSVYIRRDGRWRLALYQQTPAG